MAARAPRKIEDDCAGGPRAGSSVHVMRSLISGDSGKRRAITAAVLLSALAFAVALSAAPQFHRWLHDIGDRTNHECAATLLSSGSVEHSDCEPASVAPQPERSGPAFRSELLPRLFVSLEFSLLEHAPPALS